jgi:hypothetical protein
MGYDFGEINGLEGDRFLAIQNWILSKGFQDLSRGVRESLEAAVVYLDVVRLSLRPFRLTYNQINAKLDKFRKDAGKLPFPELLKKVNAGLKEPMAFESEFLSLQKARNCLEHRGGKVGQSDINDSASGMMVLSFPRLRVFYKKDNEEVEYVPGKPVEAHTDDNQTSLKTPPSGLSDDPKPSILFEGATRFLEVFSPPGVDPKLPVYIDRVTRTRQFALGEAFTITADDFVEIAMACLLFSRDIATKLPAPPPIVATRDAST